MTPSPEATVAAVEIAFYLDALAGDELAEINGTKIREDVSAIIDRQIASAHQRGLRDGALLPPQQD